MFLIRKPRFEVVFQPFDACTLEASKAEEFLKFFSDYDNAVQAANPRLKGEIIGQQLMFPGGSPFCGFP